MQEAYALAAEPQYGSDPFPLEQGNISAVLVKVDRTIGINPVLYWITEMNPDSPGIPDVRLDQTGRRPAHGHDPDPLSHRDVGHPGLDASGRLDRDDVNE